MDRFFLGTVIWAYTFCHSLSLMGQVKIDPDFQGSVETIDYSNGKTEILVPAKPYDAMPPEFQARIDRETYERMNRQGDSFKEFTDSLRFSSVMGGDIESFRRKMQSILKQPKLVESLDLSVEQKNAISKIESSYLADLESMKLKNAPPIVTKRIGENYFSQLFSIFRPEQIQKLESMSIERVGLAKLLTETSYGEIVGLNDSQKLRIRGRSQEIANEIEAFVSKKRQEAAKLVISELNERQRKVVSELFEAETLDRNNFLPIEDLFPQFNYEGERDILGDKKELQVWGSPFQNK